MDRPNQGKRNQKTEQNGKSQRKAYLHGVLFLFYLTREQSAWIAIQMDDR